MRKRVVAAGAVGAVAVVAIGAGGWMAFGAEDETNERGACAGTAYELNVGEDDGGLELELELQASGPGQVWRVVVEQGEESVLAGERTTDEDGELDLDVAVDPDGSPDFRVTTTPEDGEPCVVTLTR